MSTSFSKMNKNVSGRDAHKMSDKGCTDMAVVIVKEEILSDDENVQNDSDEMAEWCKITDTSHSLNERNSEVRNRKCFVNVSTLPDQDSHLVNSTAKTCRQIHKDVETDSETETARSLLHLKNVREEVTLRQEELKAGKYDSRGKKSMKKLSRLQHLEVSSATRKLRPDNSPLKCKSCDETFELKSHLVMHEMGHQQYEGHNNSSAQQDIIVIKEEVPSDDENITSFDGSVAMADEYYELADTSLPVGVECYESTDCTRSVPHSDDDDTLQRCSVLEGVTGSKQKRYCPPSLKMMSFLKHNCTSTCEKEHRENFFKLNIRKLMRRRTSEKKSITVPNLVSTTLSKDLFKCGECSETFELRSHLIMHELGHDRWRKYKTMPQPDFRKNFIPEQQLYKCNKCNLHFKLKQEFVNHELCHKNEAKECNCETSSAYSNADLCLCIVRECSVCGRNFFASPRLKNWTSCVTCYLEIKSNGAVSAHSLLKSPKLQVRDLASMTNVFKTVSGVKKLCFSCGKMCTSVIRYGMSWICSDCWNIRVKRRALRFMKKQTMKAEQNTQEYQGLKCTYCMNLLPQKCYEANHRCLHTLDYSKSKNDFKLGQHFLISSVEESFENGFSKLNQENWLNDSSGSDNDEREVHDEMVVDTDNVSDVEESASSSMVVLCDKTGELIDPKSLIQS